MSVWEFLALLNALDRSAALVWPVWAVAVVLLAGVWVWWHWLGRFRAAEPVHHCLACADDEAGELPPGDWDYDDDPDDDSDIDVALDDPLLLGETPLPVNEPRPAYRLDGRNRGAWLDHVSRMANQQNARWITGAQQERAGRSLANQAAEFLASPEAERQARWEAAHWDRGETSGEIPRQTEPGA